MRESCVCEPPSDLLDLRIILCCAWKSGSNLFGLKGFFRRKRCVCEPGSDLFDLRVNFRRGSCVAEPSLFFLNLNGFFRRERCVCEPGSDLLSLEIFRRENRVCEPMSDLFDLRIVVRCGTRVRESSSDFVDLCIISRSWSLAAGMTIVDLEPPGLSETPKVLPDAEPGSDCVSGVPCSPKNLRGTGWVSVT